MFKNMQKHQKDDLSARIISIILTIILSLSIVIGVSYILRLGLNRSGVKVEQKNVPQDENVKEETQNQELIGGQTDEHNCLIPAGYAWCEARNKCMRMWEENCGAEELDGIFVLLNDLRTKINNISSYVSDGNLEWNIEKSGIVEKNSLSGKQIVINNTAIDVKELKDFFESNGFVPDAGNIFSDITGDINGYKKENVVCSIITKIEGRWEAGNEESKPKNIEVKCGILK